MAKYNDKITIKFTYELNEYTIRININKNMTIKEEEFYTEDTALSGKKYKNYITTTIKHTWQIKYDFCNQEVYDFYKNASDSEKAGNDIVFSIEQDDGTFEDYDVLLNDFRAFNKTVTSFERQKYFKNISLEIKEI